MVPDGAAFGPHADGKTMEPISGLAQFRKNAADGLTTLSLTTTARGPEADVRPRIPDMPLSR